MIFYMLSYVNLLSSHENHRGQSTIGVRVPRRSQAKKSASFETTLPLCRLSPVFFEHYGDRTQRVGWGVGRACLGPKMAFLGSKRALFAVGLTAPTPPTTLMEP